MSEEYFIYIKKYEKLEYLGEDESSKFFKIRDKKKGHFFQAKISFREKTNKTINIKEYVKREINLMSKIEHPSILKFLGYSPKNFKGKDKSVIVTEYATNGSLFNMIQFEKQGRAPCGWNDTKKLICLYGIASGMSYLHRHQIIHRDLKTLNVHLDENFYPKIADFEFSKVDFQQSVGYVIHSDGELKGSQNYLSPEIWTEYKYSTASDVYAYGMLIYEIITQNVPFLGIPSYRVMQKVTHNERPEIDNSIPEAYNELMKLCWCQTIKDRPTFDEILLKLRTDPCFITNNINETEFQYYIKYLDDYNLKYEDHHKFFLLNTQKQQISQISHEESNSKNIYWKSSDNKKKNIHSNKIISNSF